MARSLAGNSPTVRTGSQPDMGACASKPASSGEAEAHVRGKEVTPGATATISPALEGSKSIDPDTTEDQSSGLPIAKDSYGAEEVQKPRPGRGSLDTQATAAGSSGQDGRLEDDAAEASGSEDDPQLLKEYTRLAEMLRYSPYPVGLIAVEEDNQPYVFVNNVRALFCCRSF